MSKEDNVFCSLVEDNSLFCISILFLVGTHKRCLDGMGLQLVGKVRTQSGGGGSLAS